MKAHFLPYFLLMLMLCAACGQKEQIQPVEGLFKFYGTAGEDLACDVVQTLDGGFAILGQQLDSVGNASHTALLIRTDPEGNVLWQQHYDKNGDDILHDLLYLAEEDAFIMAGETKEIGDGPLDAWICKANADGSENWSSVYLHNVANKSLNAIERVGNGQFAAVGQIEGGFGLLMVNAHGDEVAGSQVDWGNSSSSKANALAIRDYGGVDPDSSYLFAAGSKGDQSKWVIWKSANDPVTAINTDSFSDHYGEEEIVGLQPIGRDSLLLIGNGKNVGGRYEIFYLMEDWEGKSKPGKSPTTISQLSNRDVHVQSRNVVLLPDSSTVMVAGRSFDPAKGQNDIYIARYNFKTRTLLFEDLYGGPYDDVAMSIIPTHDGGFAVVGHSISFNYSSTYDIFLMRLDADGKVVSQ